MLKTTYWEHNGKYQDFVSQINTPNRGYTNNKYLNLFIISKNIYYDIYNNGGCNIDLCYLNDIKEYIIPFNKNIKSINFKTKYKYLKDIQDKLRLEQFLNEVLELIKDKDLYFKKYILYVNNKEEVFSKNKEKCNTKDFFEITFGNEIDYYKHIKTYQKIYNYQYI